ncbi:unnamed protein product [Gadus morhua 'NCC']
MIRVWQSHLMSCKSRGALGCSVVYLGEPQQPVFINCLVIDQSTGQQRGVVQGVQVESISMALSLLWLVTIFRIFPCDRVTFMLTPKPVVLVSSGPVSRGLVSRGLVSHGLVSHGLVSGCVSSLAVCRLWRRVVSGGIVSGGIVSAASAPAASAPAA